jgi:hypothetical protein
MPAFTAVKMCRALVWKRRRICECFSLHQVLYATPNSSAIATLNYCSQEQFTNTSVSAAVLHLHRCHWQVRRGGDRWAKTARVAVPGLDQRTSESETAAGTASDSRPVIAGGGAAALHRPFGGAAAAGGAAGRPRRPSMAGYFACW